jgi:dipeptidyl aminopeptidase/acylaminoacyl peptidase
MRPASPTLILPLLAALACAVMPAHADNPPAASTESAASGDPLDLLLRRYAVIDAALSPDGEKLAVTAPGKDNETVLGVIPLAAPDQFKVVGVRGRGDMIERFDWISDDRLVFSVQSQIDGSQSNPYPTGELWAVNHDATRFTVLSTWRGEGQTGTRLTRNTGQSSFAFLVDTIRDDDDTIVMQTIPISASREGRIAKLWRVDTRSGRRVAAGGSPMRDAAFLADREGVVRVAFGVTADAETRIYVRDGDGEDWRLISSSKDDGLPMYPLELADDGASMLVERAAKSGPNGIWRVFLADGRREKLLDDPVSDPVRYYRNADGRIWAALFDDGTPRIGLIGNTPEGKLQRALEKAFPNALVEIVDFTRDGKRALLRVSNPQLPGDYFLYDREAGRADYIVSRARWLDPGTMAPTRAVSIPTRDGARMVGYLTTPRGHESGALPTILWVRGGPHGVRDTADFDRTAQVFAANGYAVLRVNYRGSGGFGLAFQEAGYGQWGALMQDDLTDATRWLHEQSIADPERTCIGGGSYGGYAAMMGVTTQPDLYRCGISYVGVHDLRLMYRDGDVNDTRAGLKYLARVLGTDRDVLHERSPVAHVDALKAPVLVVAGGVDRRVPVVHAEKFIDALEAANKPHESLIKPGEGHGFYDPANVREYYTRMLAFVERHLGPGIDAPAPAATPAAAGATR